MESIKIKDLEFTNNYLTENDLEYINNFSIIEHKFKFELIKNNIPFTVNSIITEYKNHVKNFTITINGLDDEFAKTHDYANHSSYYDFNTALSVLIGRLRIAQQYYNG